MLEPNEMDAHIQTMYHVFDLAGVFLMGIIGGTIARQRGYDIIGFFFIAMFSALGGGMIRDVLINQGTVAAMANPEYLVLAFSGAVIARFVYFKGKLWERFQVHGDAVVSGLWAATGVVKGMTYHLPLLSCLMMGVFTATGGSMIRDVVTGRVPSVFGGAQPTVIPALAGGITVYAFSYFDLQWVGMVLGPLVSIVLSLYGYWAGWRVEQDPEWAPVNKASEHLLSYAQKAEEKGRSVARALEPPRARAWRHRQMERALQRRKQRQQSEGVSQQESEAQTRQLREDLASEDLASLVQVEEPTKNFGFDLDGDSYDHYDEATGTDVEEFPAITSEQVEEGLSTPPSVPPLEKEKLGQELLDVILEDEELTDRLLSRLSQRYSRQHEAREHEAESDQGPGSTLG